MIRQMLTEYNYQTGHNRSIKYIVIHYVGATGGSKANAVYFGSKNVGASAHYFVGHAGEDIYQVVADEDIAWHCGTTGTYYCGCRNANSIGVELCCWQNQDETWRFDNETVDAAVDLVRNLMDTYQIDADHVVRHYDVTHKICPEPYVRDEEAWKAFKARLVDEGANTNQGGRLTVKIKDFKGYKKGDKGDIVRVTQGLLRRCGYDIETDGSFGPATITELLNAA